MNAFKLGQQVHALQEENKRLQQKCEDYHRKLQQPALIGQPEKLREEIAFWKGEASAARTLIEQQKKLLEAKGKELDLMTAERDDARLKIKELAEAVVAARADAAVASEAAKAAPKRKRKPKAEAVSTTPTDGGI